MPRSPYQEERSGCDRKCQDETLYEALLACIEGLSLLVRLFVPSWFHVVSQPVVQGLSHMAEFLAEPTIDFARAEEGTNLGKVLRNLASVMGKLRPYI